MEQRAPFQPPSRWSAAVLSSRAPRHRDLTYPSFLIDATRDLTRVPTGRTLRPFRRFHTFCTELAKPGTLKDFELLANRLFCGEVHRLAGAPLAEYPESSSSRIETGDTVTVKFWGLRAPCLVLHAGSVKNGDNWYARLTYGTLPGHVECGEETFELTYAHGQLHARVAAFSRAGNWLTRLGGPVARAVQRRMSLRYARALIGA